MGPQILVSTSENAAWCWSKAAPKCQLSPGQGPALMRSGNTWGVWVETRRTSWRKCHCRQRTWSSQREDKEQTLEEMGGQHAPLADAQPKKRNTQSRMDRP